LRKANHLLKKTLAEHKIKMGADGTTSKDDSNIFDVDSGAEKHYIPASEAHKLDHYSTTHTEHTVVSTNSTEDPTRG
jgi:hypothetical protein